MNCGVVRLPAAVSALWIACCAIPQCNHLPDPFDMLSWQRLSVCLHCYSLRIHHCDNREVHTTSPHHNAASDACSCVHEMSSHD